MIAEPISLSRFLLRRDKPLPDTASGAMGRCGSRAFYNRLQHYGPLEGQYVYADPSSLTGGLLAHAYVKIPNLKVDPNGLRGVTVRNGGPRGCSDFVLEVSWSIYPETAGHIEDAIRAGQPATVTIDRAGPVSTRRRQSTGPHSANRCCTHDLDEWPMAMFREGGFGASVRSILRADNRGAGSSIGHALRAAGAQDGQTVCFVTIP